MLYAALALLADLPLRDVPSVRPSAASPMQMSARILRGGEASERVHRQHAPRQIRRVVETLSDGRQVPLVVFDYE
jgi:hypothetical protein